MQTMTVDGGRRRSRQRFIHTLTALVVLVAAAGCENDASRAPDGESGDVLAQWATERTYRELIGPAVDSIGTAADPVPDTLREQVLQQPMRVEVNERGHVYVLDQSDMKVKHFDGSGRFVRAYAAGSGEGSGEVTRLASFRIAESGEVVVLDAGALRITRFDSVGGVVSSAEIAHQPNDFAATGDGGYVVLTPMADHLLTRLDAAGDEVAAQSASSDVDAPQRAVLTGTLVPRSDGGFIYAPMYAGYLIGYTADLERDYHVRTVEHAPFPQMSRERESENRMEETRGTYVALAVVDDTLYAMHVNRSSGEVHLDVYGAVDGAYLYSSSVPDGCYPVSVSREHVYLVCEQSLLVRAERQQVPDVPDEE